MPNKIVPIKYTSRDFNSIKEDLVQYAKRYYPDTFRDFNEASFGALMLDTVAYVGDVLSFYLDYQVNELFMDTAVEYKNVLRLGRQQGYKLDGDASSFGEVSLYVMIPANATGLGPDPDYIPTLTRNSTFSAGSTTFTLIEDVEFAKSSNEVVAGKINESTGIPTHYAIKATGKVMSGQYYTVKTKIGAHQKFRRIRVGNRGINRIINVVDSKGNKYIEVEHLTQNTVYTPIANTSADKKTVPNILKPIVVKRRFTVERDSTGCHLQFGQGSESEMSSPSIANPRDVVLQLHGKSHVTDREFDPYNLLKTDTMGIGPENCTLSITYVTNTSSVTGVSVGGINTIGVPRFKFKTDVASTLIESKTAAIRESLDVSNEVAIPSAATTIGTLELKKRIKGHFATQNRAVTKQDYISLIYSMPAHFGTVKRVNILRDPDSFKRNLNLYIVSEDQRSKLTAATSTLKDNIKVWLNQNRMISDTVDVLDAKIINYGIEFDVRAMPGADKTAVYSRCVSALARQFSRSDRLMEIGESLPVTRMYRILNNLTGVMDVKKVKILPKTGQNQAYSEVVYDIKANMSADGQYLLVPENCILELKYPNTDIQGTVR